MNVAATLRTPATRDESTTMTEQWENTQQLADSRTTIKLRVEEGIQRSFQIATVKQPELELSAKDSKIGAATVQQSIPRDANVALRSIESGDERIKIEVDLGLRDKIPNRADASQNIKETLQISAPPFNAEASEKTSLSVQLEHRYLHEHGQRELRVPNVHQPLEMQTYAAGNEKARTVVDLTGKLHVKDETDVVRYIANKAPPVSLDADEFEESEALLYADLKTRFPHHDEARITFDIPRTIEPQVLRSKAATDEHQIVNEDWKIPEGREVTAVTKWIAFQGPPSTLKTKEAGDEARQVGYVFDQPVNKEERQMTLKDSRFGGKIELLTKASGYAEKMISAALSNRHQNEITRQKIPHRSKEEVKMQLFESTQENASTNSTFNKQPQMEHATLKVSFLSQMETVSGVLSSENKLGNGSEYALISLTSLSTRFIYILFEILKTPFPV